MAVAVYSNLDMQSVAKIVNLPDPSAAQEAATKAYVDANIEGIAWKDSARVATQANVTLSSPGATIDGITMSTSDRVLVRSQTAPAENGLYIWNGAATPMTRALDGSTSAELEAACVTVEEGTSAGVTYRQTAVNFTLDSGSVTWTVFGSSAGAASESSAGIAELATQGETDAGTDDARIVTPLKLKTASFMLRKFSANVGDGSSTQIDITHNFNTRDVVVTLYRNSGNYDDAIVDIGRTSVNAVRLNFLTAPASAAWRVVIVG